MSSLMSFSAAAVRGGGPWWAPFSVWACGHSGGAPVSRCRCSGGAPFFLSFYSIFHVGIYMGFTSTIVIRYNSI